MTVNPSRCRHCSRPLPSSHRLGNCCERAECRVAGAREAARAVAAEQMKSDQRLRQQMAGPAAIREPATYPVRRLRVQRHPLVLQSVERIARIRSHLEQVVAEATLPLAGTSEQLPADCSESFPARGAANESLESACNAACSLCAGDCCLTGEARNAYLSAATIRRVLSSRPNGAASDLVNEYLAFIPRRVTEGGCYFQGRTGCTLPRAMRSDVCNTYFCDELKALRATVLDGDANLAHSPFRAFFVVTLPSGRRQARFHESASQ